MIVDVRRAGISFICARAAASSRRCVASMGSLPTIFRLTRRRRGCVDDSRAVRGAPVARREGAAPSSAPRDAPKSTMREKSRFSGNKKG